MSAVVLLRVDRSRARPWIVGLARALTAEGILVRIEAVGGAALPVSIRALFALERRALCGGRMNGGERVDIEALGAPLQNGEIPAVVIDLASRPGTGFPQVLCVLHDGAPGEDAILATLLRNGVPVSEVVDAASGAVLDRIHPSMEAATGVSGGLASVGARLGTVLLARVRALLAGQARPPPIDIVAPCRGPARPIILVAARQIAARIAACAYRLCCYAPHWRTGWRLLDGPGILETGDLSGPAFNILPEPPGHFYADPFPYTWQGKTAVFVEDLDHRIGKGVIVAVPFDDKGPAGPALPAIEEPWHLSYPFLVESRGQLYMIPESSSARSVTLYRCVEFPSKWERCATLLADLELADATVVEHGGCWWMFGTLYDGVGGWSDTLAIYTAPDLLGPWEAHGQNPLFVDCRQARPAGAVVLQAGRLVRPVQDCSARYGGALGLAEITRLDDSGFAQAVRAVVGPGPLWPGRKLHTLNRHGRLEVIDGSVIRPRSTLLAALVERHTRPTGAKP